MRFPQRSVWNFPRKSKDLGAVRFCLTCKRCHRKGHRGIVWKGDCLRDTWREGVIKGEADQRHSMVGWLPSLVESAMSRRALVSRKITTWAGGWLWLPEPASRQHGDDLPRSILFFYLPWSTKSHASGQLGVWLVHKGPYIQYLDKTKKKVPTSTSMWNGIQELALNAQKNPSKGLSLKIEYIEQQCAAKSVSYEHSVSGLKSLAIATVSSVVVGGALYSDKAPILSEMHQRELAGGCWVMLEKTKS